MSNAIESMKRQIHRMRERIALKRSAASEDPMAAIDGDALASITDPGELVRRYQAAVRATQAVQ